MRITTRQLRKIIRETVIDMTAPPSTKRYASEHEELGVPTTRFPNAHEEFGAQTQRLPQVKKKLRDIVGEVVIVDGVEYTLVATNNENCEVTLVKN